MWYAMLKSGVHATIAGVLLAFAIPLNSGNNNNLSELLEKRLDKPVAFMILPLFALANTAIKFPNNIIESIYSLNSIGIISGLVIGKLLGIFLFTYMAIKSGIGVLPEKLNLNWIAGAGCLAGIGFTMSIFISILSFDNHIFIEEAKLSILITSLIAGILGYVILNFSGKRKSWKTER